MAVSFFSGLMSGTQCHAWSWKMPVTKLKVYTICKNLMCGVQTNFVLINCGKWLFLTIRIASMAIDCPWIFYFDLHKAQWVAEMRFVWIKHSDELSIVHLVFCGECNVTWCYLKWVNSDKFGGTDNSALRLIHTKNCILMGKELLGTLD